MVRMKRLPLLLIAISFAFQAYPAGKFALTIDNIMRGPGLYGYEPSGVRWSGDGERIYFQWKQASDPRLKPADTYVVGRDGSGLRKLSDAEAKLAPPAAGDSTRDRKRTVYSRDGDIWLYDAGAGTTRQVTNTEEIESNPHFTHDEKRVAFTRANNLYVVALDSGAIEEMTDIRPAGSPPPPEEEKGTASQETLKTGREGSARSDPRARGREGGAGSQAQARASAQAFHLASRADAWHRCSLPRTRNT